MEVIYYILLTFPVLSFTYAYYIFVMTIKPKWKGLGKGVKIIAAPQIVIGILLDVILNLLMTGIFLDLPREWLLTDRLQRYRANASGRKLRIANTMCDEWLNPFDDGHC
jgi:hypothetical protein